MEKQEYKRLNIRLTVDMKEKLEEICHKYGMTQNSMICFIIGQFIENENIKNQAIEDVKEKFVDVMKDTTNKKMSSRDKQRLEELCREHIPK